MSEFASIKEVKKEAYKCISPDEIQSFHKTNLVYPFFSVSCIWATILSLLLINYYIAAINTLYLIFLLPFSAIMIGSRFHAMSVQVHEASHYCYVRDYKKINDILCNFFVGYWILYDVNLYRTTHKPHHRFLHTKKDPDSKYYMMAKLDKKTVFKFMVRDLLMLTAFSRILDVLLNKNTLENKPLTKLEIRNLVFHLFFKLTIQLLVLLSFIIAFSSPIGFVFWFILWFFPLFSIFPTITRWRTIAEHYQPPALLSENEFFTKSFKGNTIEIWLLGSQMQYHLEHHLFPGIPYHNLKVLHKILYKRGFFDSLKKIKNSSSLKKSYLHALRKNISFV
jgi:fatty acid desaturase